MALVFETYHNEGRREVTEQAPLTNEEAVAMGYTLGEMAAAERALRLLWLIVDRERRKAR